MARQVRRRARSTNPVTIHPWEEWHSSFFRMGIDLGMKHPEHVQLRRTVRGGTYQADFHDENGRRWRFTTRVAWNAAQTEVWIVDERMQVTVRAKLEQLRSGAAK